MPSLINTNPLGEVDLPLIGRSLARGEVFDVTDEQAAALLEQVDNYALAPATSKKTNVTEGA
ncbi:hypothetical protein UFOVP1183_40 [uncultured Caudovirales phage]|uniref:Uncharacterized protein n=1 Tax=uncultured Caudovirales phage TaxID=2100421 RepID=A0A6J7XIA7_9CAUD|nr:hypothetical protein UFOVP955_42 [uncultured Caudovirales phage]CAB4185384.1 hypothetical protein UFOVP1120_46 [uncultured Caudovirales phage]CAB4188496.1 hypothetical protein UFOVP1183_40 [uncultured Caudovirales phage]CAB4191284.1 hypothetical protein UFOVP1227_23 [uncultured Caudovirales phage]CAB5230159.1 hypothetical protein UFOVP1571_46 [uncultured Caudovirales phage]